MDDMSNSPRLLDLITKNEEWLNEKRGCYGCSEEENLELSLRPPGDEKHDNNGYFFPGAISRSISPSSPWKNGSFLQFPTMGAMAEESSQHCCAKLLDSAAEENNRFSGASANTAVPITSHHLKSAPASFVGWPPIRAFRKNRVSNKSSPQDPKVKESCKRSNEMQKNERKGLFVKINMEGVAIGRKVDLKAYDSYEKLCGAVDDLFRGLLAAQNVAVKNQKEKGISGLLDEDGEYILVYEDDDGDRMLVGDVPWRMFEATAKRLRVLKRSQITTSSPVAPNKTRYLFSEE